jgi:hypothetical protein
MMGRSLAFFGLCGAALGACALDTAGLDATDQSGDGAPGDTGADAGPAAGGGGAGRTGTPDESVATTSVTGGGPAPAPLCDATRQELIGCYTFDGNPLDNSSYASNATAEAVSYVPSMHGAALKVDAASKVQIPDGPSWALTAATVEMWIKPAAIPPGSYGDTTPRAGLLDKEGQVGLFLQPGGRLSCSLGGNPTGGNVLVDVWTHVACTTDGAQATLYINGTLIASQPASTIQHTAAAVSIGANSPSGDPFDGAIDDLRVWSVARTEAELFEAAGPARTHEVLTR